MPERRQPDDERRDPFVVDVERAHARRNAGPFAIVVGAGVVLVIALSTWGLLVPPAPTTQPIHVAGSPIGSPALPRVTPPPADPVVRGVTRSDAALAELAADAGWDGCPLWRAFAGPTPVSPDLVAAAMTRTGIDAGLIEVDDLSGGATPVWLGADASGAIGAVGGTRAVPDGGTVWTDVRAAGPPPIAIQLAPETLPDGTVYWQERTRMLPAPYCVDGSSAGPRPRVLQVDAAVDPLQRLFGETGMDRCRTWRRLERADTGMDDDVDAAAELAGIPADGSGWVTVPVQPGYGAVGTRVWMGHDPAEAGARHDATLIVLQPGGQPGGAPVGIAWMAMTLDGRPGAIELRVIDTPAGRRAWVPTPNAAGTLGPCQVTLPEPPDGSPLPTGATEPADGSVGATVEFLRGGGSALAMLTDHFSWGGCRVTMTSGVDPPPPALVDRAALEADVATGWIEVRPVVAAAPVRFWLGDDLVPLARAAGVTVVTLDGTTTAWLADPTRARAWRVVVTPAGRTAWFETGGLIAPDGPCSGGPGAPDTLAGVRSYTCWTDGAKCLEAAREAMRSAPDAFGPGTAVAAGVGGSCPIWARCPWAGPNMPVVVTAAPADWSTSADVRAFTMSARRLPSLLRELPPDEIDWRILAMASRPSLSLPASTPGETAAAYCPANGITGPLVGSPWDPRVAWVGPNSVRWPAGFTGRFTPGLELVSPLGHVFRAGEVLQVAGTAGAEPVFVACRVTGGPDSTPLLSAP